MKHKTSELTGALLDAAVVSAMPENPDRLPFSPSTSWEDGGPIIERERIGLWAGEEPYHGTPATKDWFAEVAGPRYPGEFKGRGPTPLISAMRAYVTSRFGEWVELP